MNNDQRNFEIMVAVKDIITGCVYDGEDFYNSCNFDVDFQSDPAEFIKQFNSHHQLEQIEQVNRDYYAELSKAEKPALLPSMANVMTQEDGYDVEYVFIRPEISIKVDISFPDYCDDESDGYMTINLIETEKLPALFEREKEATKKEIGLILASLDKTHAEAISRYEEAVKAA